MATMTTDKTMPDTDATTVFQKAQACRSQFEQCLQSRALSGGDFLIATFGQFNWWSVAIGAEKEGPSSLDHRTRSRPDIRMALVRFLDVLHDSLQTCIKLDKHVCAGGNAEDIGIIKKAPPEGRYDNADDIYLDPPSESSLGEHFSYIKISMNYLTKISAAILRSGTRFRHQRADRELESRQDELKPFHDHMCNMVHIEIYKATHSGKITFDTTSGIPTKDLPLNAAQKRLIEANIIRRNRFDVYSREQQQKNQSQANNVGNTTSSKFGQTTITPDPGNSVTASMAGKPKQHSPSSAPEAKGEPNPSREATDIAPSFKVTSTTANHQRSPASTTLTQTAQKQDWPPCPSEDGKDFWCPYCAQPLDSTHSNSKNRKKWHAHLAQDVAPYVCIYNNCPRPTSECMYVHTAEWKQHLEEFHSEPCWVCDFCDTGADNTGWVRFRTEEEWVQHFKAIHHQELMDDVALADMKEASRTTALFPIICPLCGNEADPPRTDINHIADHLHSFALYSFSTWNEQNDDSGGNSWKSQIVSPVTSKEFQISPSVPGSDVPVQPGDLHQLLSTISQLCHRITENESKYPRNLRETIHTLEATVERLQSKVADIPSEVVFFQLTALEGLLSNLSSKAVEEEIHVEVEGLYDSFVSAISTATDELNTGSAASTNLAGVANQGGSEADANTSDKVEETEDHIEESDSDMESFDSIPVDEEPDAHEQLPALYAGSDVASASIPMTLPSAMPGSDTMSQSIARYNRLGINDSRVQSCFDRGNTFFDEDVPMPRHTRSNGTNYKDQDWKNLVGKLGNELYDSTENPEWGGTATTFFLPRQSLRSIITPERVRVIVTGLTSFSHYELETFVQAAFHGGVHDGAYRKPSVKLLAALICCEEVERYLDLVYEGVSDVCLPPGYNQNDHKKSLICTSADCKTSHTFLGDISIRHRIEFYTWAYRLNAPYFKKPKPDVSTHRLHYHYYLNDDDVLPILSSSVQEPGSSRSRSGPAARTVSSELQGAFASGYSTVTRVEFHHDHYDFGTRNGKKYKVFALKKLNSSNKESFSNELASLLTSISDDNEHLVELLASFEIQNLRNKRTEYYLLFPWSDGTLWDFWKLNDALDRRISLSQWMCEQCYQLAMALQMFHNERKDLKSPDIKGDDLDLYGRHGDIKAENILWFEKQSKLVLNDFGLARLHSKISRSSQDPNNMARTETYRAPEFDMPGSKISRASDIFSLGCAFLEFATWFVEGYHSASEEFVEVRSEPDPYTKFKLDTFFKIEVVDGKRVSMIKPQVKRWIQRLREHRNCTQFILDFLDLVEGHMLDPDPKKRFQSGRVVKRLRELRLACRSDTSYWKDLINQ